MLLTPVEANNAVWVPEMDTAICPVVGKYIPVAVSDPTNAGADTELSVPLTLAVIINP
jgi:hypothetical protein